MAAMIKKAFYVNIYKKADNQIEEKDMSTWTSRAQMLIFIVSFLDASIISIAIGYILYSLAVNIVLYVSIAVLIWLIVFPTIVIIDASITTFDTNNYHNTTSNNINGHKKGLGALLKKWYSSARSSLLGALFFRLFMYFIVFIISFKSLQFIFNELMQENRSRTFAKIEKSNADSLGKKKMALSNEIERISNQLYKEASGTGDSKKPGVGPSYKTLQQRKRELERELQIVDSSSRTDFKIDSLTSLPDSVLVKKFPGKGFIAPPRISLQYLEFFFGKEEIYFHELIAAILSLILFLSIIILKLTGGERINKIYYNASLQDLYHDYLHNNLHEKHMKEIRDYSTVLDNNYRPSAESFYRWFTEQYPKTELTLIQDTMQRIQHDKMTYLDDLIARAEERKRQKAAEYDLLEASVNTSEEALQKANTELLQRSAAIDELKTNISDIEQALKGPVNSSFVINLTKSQNFQKDQQKSEQAYKNAAQERINAIRLAKTGQEYKKALVEELKKNDEMLYKKLLELRASLIMLFAKVKLSPGNNQDEQQEYRDWVSEVIEVIGNIVKQFLEGEPS
jgi:hypothetical protein